MNKLERFENEEIEEEKVRKLINNNVKYVNYFYHEELVQNNKNNT